MTELLWYHVHQNKSFGEWMGPAQAIIVGAICYSDAITLLKEVGVYFDGVSKGIDCPCCGDRWDRPDSTEGRPRPNIYGDEEGIPEIPENDFLPADPKQVSELLFVKRGSEHGPSGHKAVVAAAYSFSEIGWPFH